MAPSTKAVAILAVLLGATAAAPLRVPSMMDIATAALPTAAVVEPTATAAVLTIVTAATTAGTTTETAKPRIMTTEPDENETKSKIMTTEPDETENKPKIMTTEPDEAENVPKIMTIEPDEESKPKIMTTEPDEFDDYNNAHFPLDKRDPGKYPHHYTAFGKAWERRISARPPWAGPKPTPDKMPHKTAEELRVTDEDRADDKAVANEGKPKMEPVEPFGPLDPAMRISVDTRITLPMLQRCMDARNGEMPAKMKNMDEYHGAVTRLVRACEHEIAVKIDNGVEP